MDNNRRALTPIHNVNRDSSLSGLQLSPYYRDAEDSPRKDSSAKSKRTKTEAFAPKPSLPSLTSFKSDDSELAASPKGDTFEEFAQMRSLPGLEAQQLAATAKKSSKRGRTKEDDSGDAELDAALRRATLLKEVMGKERKLLPSTLGE